MNEPRQSPFGNTLRRLREDEALTQEELAERAGLSVRGVSDLERGVRTTPRLETVRMLADGLGLDNVARRELLNARNESQAGATAPAPPVVPGLPVPVTSFIGREEELASIDRLVRRDNQRLVTLLGPGGMGKTRIAIEVAHRLEEYFPSGASFVDLSAVRHADWLLPTVATHMGVSELSGQELREVLSVALQGRQLLLVLDNLEQIIDAAGDVAWLHASFPGLVILVTSRVRLRVSAECVVPIEPLLLPAGAGVILPDLADAVTLFLDRARAINPRFMPDATDMKNIVAIVTKLQGMPLAIELAAARVRLLPLADLLTRLDSQLSLLGHGARDAPERQRTMRDTILWSYDLLSPVEQVVFRTLSIFPEGCTLNTAIAVVGASHGLRESETLDAVEALVDSSILRPHPTLDGDVRYQMLQTLQEFGLEQLAAADEETVARRAAHDAWCVPLAREVEWVMLRPDAVAWLNRMESEHQNVRAHVSWVIRHDYLEDALDISASFTLFRAIRGHLGEGRRELEMLLVHPQNQARTELRMRGLIGLGAICVNQADAEQAFRAFESGISIARELGNDQYRAWGLIGLGISMSLKGRLDDAELLTRESISLGLAMGDRHVVAGGLTNLGVYFDQRGNLQQAYEFMEEGLAQNQSINNLWGSALGELNLSSMSMRRGELDQAEQLILQSQRLFNDLGDRRDLPVVYLSLANIARLRGDLDTAERWLEQSLDMAREIGSMLDIANGYRGLAHIARMRNDISGSQTYTCTAIQWYERTGDLVDAALCLNTLAEIAVMMGHPQRGAWCIGAVDSVLAEHRMLRTDLVPGEHQARIDSVRLLLSDDDWQSNYDRGFAMLENDILTEVKSWLSCHETR